MRKQLRRCALLALSGLLFAGGCHKEKEPATGDPKSWEGFAGSTAPVLVGHTVKPSELSATEIRYGIAPKRGPGVTYQDGIILMEHGDKAITAFASDGMSWTFDANAPQVNEIQEGKILFATDRCAGKVLAVQRDGNKVTVVLGPVQLNELVKEGNFSYNQPLDLNNAIAVATPDSPGAINSPALQQEISNPTPTNTSFNYKPHKFKRTVKYYVVSDQGVWTPMRTVSPSGPRLRNAIYHPGSESEATFRQIQNLGGVPINPGGFPPGQLPINPPAPPAVPFPNLQPLDFNNLKAWPCANCGGIGLKVYQEKDGVTVVISIIFHLNNPQLIFDASIGGNGVNARVQLKGGAGVSISIDGSTGDNFKSIKGNIKEIGIVPLIINVPLGTPLVPLTAQLSQSLNIDTGFSARNSVLKASGNVDFDGAIEASYTHGNGWAITKPSAQVKSNFAGLVSGVSVGINSVVLAFDQRLLVGVGSGGFAAGPYVDLLTTLTALKQTSTTTIDCRQATFNISIGAGIGYGMPKIVAKVINFFLGLFHVKPIAQTGTIVALPKREDLVTRRDELPDGCSGK
jgi:hypothetical protein